MQGSLLYRVNVDSGNFTFHIEARRAPSSELKGRSVTARIAQLLEQIVEKLKAEYKPERVILFGSYAYGTPHEDSDIDLFIVKETDRRRFERGADVKRILTDSERRIPISPLVYTPLELGRRLEIGDQFIEEVMTRGKMLYSHDE